MKKTTIILIIVIILLGVYLLSNPTTEEVVGVEEKTNLESVGEYQGDGIATRIFKDGTFTHTVLANISDPSEGKFYEGWLVKKTGGVVTDFFSTGKMELSEEGSYTLTFTSETNHKNHDDVVITEKTEALGLDGNPEDHVLDGTF